MQYDPKVDLCFQITGRTLPVDHGFALYGAINRILPCIHEDREIGLKLIRGRYIGDGIIDISPRSELVLRLPAGQIGVYIALAGKAMEIAGHKFTVGIPATRSLIPAVALSSPLVTTKNGTEQARFETEIKNQMETLGLNGRVTVGKRRTFKVHGKQVVGYSILVTELSPEESILLQENGLGGRRKMGCGFFEVWKR